MANAELEYKIRFVPEMDVAKMNQFLLALKASLGAAGADIKPIDPKAFKAVEAGSDSVRQLQKELAEAGRVGSEAFDKIDHGAQRVDGAAVRTSKAFLFNQTADAVKRMSDAMDEAIGIGAAFEADLAAVGAVTGLNGDGLEELGLRARSLALTFGGDASSQLKSFQGILSKLGPEYAQNSAALGTLATNVNVLSAASGDAADTSMSAMVDSMLQFGLVTGDASRDAETSTRVINALAASAQVGAAEIPQVAQAILQAGVAAKGARLSFEQTNAAIQVLAVGGKTGSEAGVALRNVLGLLQNASGPAQGALAKLGTSTKELGELLTTRGLDAALGKVKAGMDSVGSAAEQNALLMQIFGTENSAAAGILLDNVDKLQQFEEGIIAGQQGIGAAFEQAAVRMDTTQTGIAKLEAFAKDRMISLFQLVGTGFSTVAGATTTIAPMIASLSGLKDVFPTDTVLKYGQSLLNVAAPALARVGILKAVGVAQTIADTTATGTNTVSKVTQAVATNAATGAQYGLNAAMLATPFGVVLLAVGAIAAGIAIFASQSKSLKETTEDAGKSLENFQKATAAVTATQRQQQELGKLSDEYDRLKNSTDPESQRRFAEVTKELADRVPEASVAVDKLDASGHRVGSTFEISTKAVRDFAAEQAKLAQKEAADAMKDLDDQTRALAESIRDGSAGLDEMRQKREALSSAQGAQAHEATAWGIAMATGPLGVAGKLLGVFGDSKEALADTRAEMAAQSEELQKAKDQLTKNVELYRQQGFSAEEIAAKTGLATNEVFRYGGSLQGSIIDAGKLESAIAGMTAEQQRAARQVADQAQQYRDAQTAVDELKARIAGQQKLGIDTKDLEAQLTEAEKTAKEKRIQLEATVKTTGDPFKDLQGQARQSMGKVIDTVDASLGEIERKAQESKLGEAITAAGQIKGSLDRQGHIAQLVEQYKNAGTEAERNGLAAKIAREVPSAITGIKQIKDEQGNLVSVYQVSTDAATEFIDSQSKGLQDRLLPLNREVINTLDQQVQRYNKNKAALVELGNQISQQSKAGKDVSELQRRYEELEKTVQQNATAVAKTVKEGRNVGLLQGDIEKMATGFGKGADRARDISQAVASIPAEVRNAAASIPDLAAAFDKGFSEIKKTRDESIKAAAKTYLDGGNAAEFTKEIKAADAEQRRFQEALDRFDPDKQRQAAEKARKEAEQRAKDAQKRAEELAKFEEKLRSDSLTTIGKLESSAIEDRRRKALTDIQSELNDRIRAIDSELVEAKKKFGETAQIKSSLGEIPLEELKRQATELISLDEQTFRQRLDALGGNSNKRLLAMIEALQKERKVIADANAATLKDLIDDSNDILKRQAEIIDDEASRLGDKTGSDIRARAAATIRALETETRAQLQTLLLQNAEFVKQFNAIAALPDQERALALQRLIDDAIKAAEPDSALARAIEKMQAEIAKIRGDADRAAGDKERQEFIARITDRNLRGLAIALDQAQKIFEEEERLAGKNRTLRMEAEVKHHAAIYDIELDYQKKSNDVVLAALSFQKGAREAFFATDDPVQRAATERRIEEIRKEQNAIRDKYRTGVIEAAEFHAKIDELGRQRGEAERQLATQRFDLETALGRALTAGAKEFESEKSKSVEEGVSKLTEFSKAGLSFSAEAGQAQVELLKNAGLQAVANMSSALGQMIELGTLNMKALGNSVLASLFDLAKKQVLIQTPAILAMFQGFIPPPFGLIAGTAAIALLEAGLAAAQGFLRFNKGGTVPGGDPSLGDIVPILATPTEEIFNPDISRRERDLFTALQRGVKSEEYFFKRYGHTFVDEQGRLMVMDVVRAVDRNATDIVSLRQDMTDALKQILEGQDRIAQRFESRMAIEHSFDEPTLTGDQITFAIKASHETNLSR